MFSKLICWLFCDRSHLPTNVDVTSTDTIDTVQQYLGDICLLMPKDQTSNHWREIFHNMQTILQKHPNPSGIEQVSKIWFGIHGGMGSWSDYYIPHEDQDKMNELNTELESMCARISTLLPHPSTH